MGSDFIENIDVPKSNSNHLGNLGLILYFSSNMQVSSNPLQVSLVDYIPNTKGLIGIVLASGINVQFSCWISW